MKYRKKPVVIDAMHYTVLNYNEICKFVGKDLKIEWESQTVPKLYIPTLEGEMIASKGDWIIKGVNGEFYPCKPDIFEKTYEKVSDDIFKEAGKIF